MIASKDDHAHFPFLYKYVTLPSRGGVYSSTLES